MFDSFTYTFLLAFSNALMCAPRGNSYTEIGIVRIGFIIAYLPAEWLKRADCESPLQLDNLGECLMMHIHVQKQQHVGFCLKGSFHNFYYARLCLTAIENLMFGC